MTTRDDILRAHPLVPFLEARGVKLRGKTANRCPAKEHGKDHWCVTITDNKLWHCNDCDTGGTVIDWLILGDGLTVKAAMEKLAANGNGHAPAFTPAKATIVKTYPYQNELGREVFQVVRLEPKSFRQRHAVEGKWVWGMEGIQRVLYRLPQVILAQTVWIVEGEKDADSLAELGITATCNVGGAGKWLDGYTESLAGKDVVICGDNDNPGKEHVELVFESLAGKVKTARVLPLPKTFKDVSDFIAAQPSPEAAKTALEAILSECTAFVRGIKLPIYSLPELELRYKKQIRETASVMLHLGKWLPSLNRIRPLIPGELVLLLGDTGIGKSALLQNIARHSAPLPTLMFELELPGELLYERFAAILTGMGCDQIENSYRSEDGLLGEDSLLKLSHVFICSEPSLTVDEIEQHILRAELKMGERPRLVLLDYVQLVKGKGERYERTSDTAEALKRLAKATQTIIVCASQITRPKEQKKLTLHSGKDSGSLENSAGLVIGATRDAEDETLLHLCVLKNTKGKGSGKISVECNFDGETMRITERSKISDDSVPRQRSTQPDP